MSNKPAFITFCGADDVLHINDMMALSLDYPVEWGILLSPERSHRNLPRYPNLEFYNELFRRPMRAMFSLHLCGGFVEDLLATGGITWLVEKWIVDNFSRVQLNITDKHAPVATHENIERAMRWLQARGAKAILRSSDTGKFPDSQHYQYRAYWLFDASGGNGIEPADWPSEPTTRLVGYAGGIGPANVAQIVSVVGQRAQNYWLDMESKIRTTDLDDKFSVAKCRAVCEAVYGTPKENP